MSQEKLHQSYISNAGSRVSLHETRKCPGCKYLAQNHIDTAGGGEEYELQEERFYSPEEGYSTPPEDFAASSPQSFTSEAGSSQHAESPGAAGRGEGEPPGGSYRAEMQPAAPRRGEGGPLGGSTQSGERQSGDGGRAAQPGEAATGPKRCTFNSIHTVLGGLLSCSPVRLSSTELQQGLAPFGAAVSAIR